MIENFTGAIGTVIFVAYISALCGNPLHTATQYALLTALASTGRTLLSSGTGFVVDAIGWPAFFIATAAGRAAGAGAAGLAAAARAFRAAGCGARRRQIASMPAECGTHPHDSVGDRDIAGTYLQVASVIRLRGRWDATIRAARGR